MRASVLLINYSMETLKKKTKNKNSLSHIVYDDNDAVHFFKYLY